MEGNTNPDNKPKNTIEAFSLAIEEAIRIMPFGTSANEHYGEIVQAAASLARNYTEWGD